MCRQVEDEVKRRFSVWIPMRLDEVNWMNEVRKRLNELHASDETGMLAVRKRCSPYIVGPWERCERRQKTVPGVYLEVYPFASQRKAAPELRMLPEFSVSSSFSES